jgi:hypothetical protein
MSTTALRAMLDEIEAASKNGASTDAAAEARAKSFERALAQISTSLADLVELAENKPNDSGALIEAIKAIKFPEFPQIKFPSQPAPAVNVQVNPTPITVEALIPSQPAQAAPVVNVDNGQGVGATWQVTIPSGSGWPARTMTIKRTA